MLTFDEEDAVWTLRHKDVVIRSATDIERWRELLTAELTKIKTIGADLLISLDGFTLDPSLAEAYGRVAKAAVGGGNFGSVIRYGAETDMTTTAIRLGAVLSRFPSNIFPDRRHALAALQKVRTL
ncbi:MAG: hypothetical protein AAF721_12930 [Myxococcota bacterium]